MANVTTYYGGEGSLFENVSAGTALFEAAPAVGTVVPVPTAAAAATDLAKYAATTNATGVALNYAITAGGTAGGIAANSKIIYTNVSMGQLFNLNARFKTFGGVTFEIIRFVTVAEKAAATATATAATVADTYNLAQVTPVFNVTVTPSVAITTAIYGGKKSKKPKSARK